MLSKIPASVQGHNNCQFIGTQFGAAAVSQCSRLSLPAGTIIYYLYPSPAALASGVSSLLSDNHFHKNRECTGATSSPTSSSNASRASTTRRRS